MNQSKLKVYMKLTQCGETPANEIWLILVLLKGPITQAIFVALKLQLQNRTGKAGATFRAICRRDIAGVSTMLGTVAILIEKVAQVV